METPHLTFKIDKKHKIGVFWYVRVSPINVKQNILLIMVQSKIHKTKNFKQ